MNSPTQNLHSFFAKVIKELDAYPNSPYNTLPIETYIMETLNIFKSIISIREDHAAIYANYHSGSSRKKIVIDTHLDHPGFVLKDSRVAQAIGSFSTQKLSSLEDIINPVSISFFERNGREIGEGVLYNFTLKNNKIEAQVEVHNSDRELKKNDQAIPKLFAQCNDHHFEMRAADNNAPTTVIIAILYWLLENKPTANITFIFNKLEEVKQISASIIAYRNTTPFFALDNNTYIFVLEAASVGQTTSTILIKDIKPTYNDGPVIRIADNELPYMKFGMPNLLESLLLTVAEENCIITQHAPLINNCNATPYVLFSNCQNIIGVTIPCKNKHNLNSHGDFKLERVKVDDLIQTYKLLIYCIERIKSPIDIHPKSILNGKENEFTLPLKMIRDKKRSWIQTAIWAESRLKAGKLFPESVSEYFQFLKSSAISRIIGAKF